MIKLIKIGDSIYQSIEAKRIDENGNEVWNIPSDLTELKQAAVDTINWVIGQKIKKAIENNQTLLSASNSKAISLLAKVIDSLNPDISNLTDKEKAAYSKILQLASNGYSDSNLLNKVLDEVLSSINIASMVGDIQNATTIDEVVASLNSL